MKIRIQLQSKKPTRLYSYAPKFVRSNQLNQNIFRSPHTMHLMIPTTTPKDLRNAYKKEKDPRVRARMAAVNRVCMNNDSIQKTADSLMQSPNWVSFWVECFEDAGIEGLRDSPKRKACWHI